MVTKNAARNVRPMIGNSRPGNRIIASGIQASTGMGRNNSRTGKRQATEDAAPSHQNADRHSQEGGERECAVDAIERRPDVQIIIRCEQRNPIHGIGVEPFADACNESGQLLRNRQKCKYIDQQIPAEKKSPNSKHRQVSARRLRNRRRNRMPQGIPVVGAASAKDDGATA